jgi:cation diffusion facilitator CzcD-associated flavoprotein CzcO
MMRDIDVLVIGGGQAALALGFYLRRSGLSYVILDDQGGPGGAWPRTWDSLRLFSPAQWSSLPGYLMPRTGDEYPTRSEVIAYLTEYERRYALPIERPVHVDAVERTADRAALAVRATRAGRDEVWRARAVVSATGNWAHPIIPDVPGQSVFKGLILHSANYNGPAQFTGLRVVVVGGGNSGAQIVAELSQVADVTWATLRPPTFLPDEIDGRYLFEQATLRYRALQEGRTPDPPRSLGDIVAVPVVREARARGVLESRSMLVRFTEHGVVWPDDSVSDVDVVIWATGFHSALEHLAPLDVVNANGRIDVAGTRAVDEPRLWLLGYGEWTGYASATLIGVGRSARATVDEIVKSFQPPSTADH